MVQCLTRTLSACFFAWLTPQVLESAPFERVEAFFYKYSYTLMDAEPSRTVAAWISKPGAGHTPPPRKPPPRSDGRSSAACCDVLLQA